MQTSGNAMCKMTNFGTNGNWKGPAIWHRFRHMAELLAQFSHSTGKCVFLKPICWGFGSEPLN